MRWLTLIAVILSASSYSATAGQHCVTREAGRSMLEAGQIAPFPDAARRAGIPSEQIRGVDLCPSGGTYRYEVEVLRSKQKAREVISAEPERRGRRNRRR